MLLFCEEAAILQEHRSFCFIHASKTEYMETLELGELCSSVGEAKREIRKRSTQFLWKI